MMNPQYLPGQLCLPRCSCFSVLMLTNHFYFFYFYIHCIPFLIKTNLLLIFVLLFESESCFKILFSYRIINKGCGNSDVRFFFWTWRAMTSWFDLIFFQSSQFSWTYHQFFCMRLNDHIYVTNEKSITIVGFMTTVNSEKYQVKLWRQWSSGRQVVAGIQVWMTVTNYFFSFRAVFSEFPVVLNVANVPPQNGNWS